MYQFLIDRIKIETEIQCTDVVLIWLEKKAEPPISENLSTVNIFFGPNGVHYTEVLLYISEEEILKPAEHPWYFGIRFGYHLYMFVPS